MNTTIISASIGASVALVGAILAYISAKQQLKISFKEIELKQSQLEFERKRLSNIGDDLQKEMAKLHQDQLQEILKKRIEIYPYLWEVVTVHWQHYENNRKDKNWCKTFLKELKRCNEKYGVYFSQAVYEQYHALYMELKRIYIDLEISGTIIDNTHIDTINILWYGGENYGLGLASQLKNDLGSYKIALIQDRQTH